MSLLSPLKLIGANRPVDFKTLGKRPVRSRMQGVVGAGG